MASTKPPNVPVRYCVQDDCPNKHAWIAWCKPPCPNAPDDTPQPTDPAPAPDKENQR